MSNTHTWILSQLLKMSPFFPPAETLKLEILKTFLLMRYLVNTTVMWQEMILRVMDISQRLWNILSLLKMLFIIFIYFFIFLVLYSASCDWLLLWAIRTQAMHMLLKVEVRIILKWGLFIIYLIINHIVLFIYLKGEYSFDKSHTIHSIIYFIFDRFLLKGLRMNGPKTQTETKFSFNVQQFKTQYWWSMHSKLIVGRQSVWISQLG